MNAGGDEARKRLIGEAGNRSGAKVREGADVEHSATAGELADEARIVVGPYAVPEPVGTERLEAGPTTSPVRKRSPGPPPSLA